MLFFCHTSQLLFLTRLLSAWKILQLEKRNTVTKYQNVCVSGTSENSCKRTVPHGTSLTIQNTISLDKTAVTLQFVPERLLKLNTMLQTQFTFHLRNDNIRFAVNKNNSIIENGEMMNTSTVTFQFSGWKKFNEKLCDASY